MILGEDQRDFSWIDTYMKWQTKGVGFDWYVQKCNVSIINKSIDFWNY